MKAPLQGVHVIAPAKLPDAGIPEAGPKRHVASELDGVARVIAPIVCSAVRIEADTGECVG